MKFSPPLAEAILLRRYKRFLADVRLPDGGEITLHCPNTGAMLGCAESGSRVCYSLSNNPARKYPGTWELVETAGRHLACINTARANALVEEALRAGHIAALAGYSELRREVVIGGEGSRLDFVLSGHARRPDDGVEVAEVEARHARFGQGRGVRVGGEALGAGDGDAAAADAAARKADDDVVDAEFSEVDEDNK